MTERLKDVELSITRNKNGLFLWVRTCPAIEEYFRSSAPKALPISQFGAGWTSANPDEEYMAYHNPSHILQTLNQDGLVKFDAIGLKMTTRDDYGRDLYNMSFLRIQGISNPGGITIKLQESVLSASALMNIRDQLLRHIKTFCNNYVRDVEMKLTVYRDTTTGSAGS